MKKLSFFTAVLVTAFVAATQAGVAKPGPRAELAAKTAAHETLGVPNVTRHDYRRRSYMASTNGPTFSQTDSYCWNAVIWWGRMCINQYEYGTVVWPRPYVITHRCWGTSNIGGAPAITN